MFSFLKKAALVLGLALFSLTSVANASDYPTLTGAFAGTLPAPSQPPILSYTPGGVNGARTVYVVETYRVNISAFSGTNPPVTAETLPGPEASISIPANNHLVINPPPVVNGEFGWNIYISPLGQGSGSELAVVNNILKTNDIYTEVGSYLTTGQAPPTSNAAYGTFQVGNLDILPADGFTNRGIISNGYPVLTLTYPGTSAGTILSDSSSNNRISFSGRSLLTSFGYVDSSGYTSPTGASIYGTNATVGGYIRSTGQISVTGGLSYGVTGMDMAYSGAQGQFNIPNVSGSYGFYMNNGALYAPLVASALTTVTDASGQSIKMTGRSSDNFSQIVGFKNDGTTILDLIQNVGNGNISFATSSSGTSLVNSATLSSTQFVVSGAGTGGANSALSVPAGDIYTARANSTGVIYLGNSGAYVYFDGTNYQMPGHSLVLNGTTYTSKRALKTQIENADSYDALAVLDKADHFYTYCYRATKGDTNHIKYLDKPAANCKVDGRRIGFMADDKGMPTEIVGTKHDHVDAGNLAALDTIAIRQLQKQLAFQQNEILALSCAGFLLLVFVLAKRK